MKASQRNGATTVDLGKRCALPANSDLQPVIANALSPVGDEWRFRDQVGNGRRYGVERRSKDPGQAQQSALEVEGFAFRRLADEADR